MGIKEAVKYVESCENHIRTHGITNQLVEGYVGIAKNLLIEEPNHVDYALKVSARAKDVLEEAVRQRTNGAYDLWGLEKYAFANNTKIEIVDTNYEILLLEARKLQVDSYFRYLEKNREPVERFYMPKRKVFYKHELTQSFQGLIDDKYDILCISLPPGTGKTTAEKFFLSGVIGWYPNDYNLFYSHSGDITRMFYDGMYDIVSNNDEYTWNEIFPNLRISSTNAKMEQFNVGKYKPFPSIQCTTVGAKNSGKVRASRFLGIDDMIGGFEEATNPKILDKLFNNYSVDARQRKTKSSDGTNCKEIIIATRWSVNDVIGRVIRLYDGDPRVKIIAVPDIDEKTGESNFMYEYGGFDVEFFKDQQKVMDEISYRCLYKQDPIEREGLLFPSEKLRRYLELPHGQADIITGQCDTKGKGTDYFVLPVLAKYGDDYYCIDAICNNSADYELQYENAANIIVNNEVQECEFERNAGGDRVAMEVNKRVQEKGWVCNITDAPTETNKEARIFQTSAWIIQHVIFKDESMYDPNEPYGIMMGLLTRYSVSAKKQLDDVPDVFSNFALRKTKENRVSRVEAVVNPFRRGYTRY